jgi:ubiquinol-cytochrome c reductase iron-sulfur subunit
MPDSADRRFYLRVAAKLLALLALGAFALILLSGLLPERERSQPGFRIAAAGVAELLRLDWGGRRVLVLRRDPAAVAHLSDLNAALADPESRQSEQPANAANGARSDTAEFFVAFDYDPDFGCPVEFVTAAETVPVTPWLGGFRAPCSGSWFDLAGRVYRDQRTARNLRIPPHRVEAGHIVLGE